MVNVRLFLDFKSFDDRKKEECVKNYISRLPYESLSISEDCWTGGIAVEGGFRINEYTGEKDFLETEILKGILDYAVSGCITYTAGGHAVQSSVIKRDENGYNTWIDESTGKILLRA